MVNVAAARQTWQHDTQQSQNIYLNKWGKKADWPAAVAMTTGPAELALSLCQIFFLPFFCHLHSFDIGVLR